MEDYYVEVLSSKGVWYKVCTIGEKKLFKLRLFLNFFLNFQAILLEVDKDFVIVKFDSNR
jgi:hypothetical protein